MTANIERIPQSNEAKGRLRRLLWVSPLAMLSASAVNLGLYAAAGQLFPRVAFWPGAGPAQIIGATVVYLLIGTIVFALVARFARRPVRTYTILATKWCWTEDPDLTGIRNTCQVCKPEAIISTLGWIHVALGIVALRIGTYLYVAFRFTSDSSVSGSPYDGAFIDTFKLVVNKK